MFATRNAPRFLRGSRRPRQQWKALAISPAQVLYGKAALDQIDTEFMAPIVARMNSSGKLPLPVDYGGCYTGYRDRDIEGGAGKSLESLLAMLDEPECPYAYLILLPFAFPPDCVFTPFFQQLPLPALLFDTAFHKSVPWDNFTLGQLNTQQHRHAGPTLYNAVNKAERWIPQVVGYWDADAVLGRIGRWMTDDLGSLALVDSIRNLVTKKLPGTRVGCVGGTMNNVGCTTVDRGWLTAQTGVILRDIPTWQFEGLVNAVTTEEITPIIAEWRGRYDWSRVGEDADKIAAIEYQARLLAAQRRLIDLEKLDAWTTNFESLGTLDQLPSLSVQDGDFPWAPEGEGKGAALELMLFELIRGDPDAYVTVAEPYRLCFAHDIDVLMHMTEVRRNCAGKAKPKLDASVMPIGGRTKLTARCVHWAESGDALLVNIADQRSHPALVVEMVDIVDPPSTNDQQEMAAIACRHRIPLESAVRQWNQSRANHHPRLVKGLTISDITRLTEGLGWELVIVQ